MIDNIDPSDFIINLLQEKYDFVYLKPLNPDD